MRKIKFFAFLICILVLFNALPFVAFAQTQQDIITEQKAELKKSDVPELLSFEQARESGHTLRLHSKEDSNTVVFQNQDGTETMYLFDETIKYTDKDGKTFDKSNKLTEVSEGTFKNLSNDISVTYPKQISDGVSVEHKDFTLKLVPVISSTSKQVGSFKESDTQISYAGAFGSGTKLVYSQTFSGFKEDIILYTPPLKNSFEFRVYTESTLLKDASGRIAAYYNNEKIGEFGDIVIYDANNVYAFGTTELEYVKEGVYKLTVNVPAEYLADESRVYPVTVDPMLTISTSAANETIIDATLYSGYDNCYSSYFTMFVGNFDNWTTSVPTTRGTARAVMNFPGLYSNSTFQKYAFAERITSVKLTLTVYKASTSSSIIAHHMTSSWNESNVENRKSAIWNSISSYSTDAVNISSCDYGDNPKYTFDITNIVLEQVKEETMPRCGIMLKAVNENTPAVCFNTSESGESSGVSASKPYIVISYASLSSTETEGIISDGIYQIVNKATGKALSFSNMALSQQTSNQSSNTQLFKIAYVSGGRYRIIPMSNTNYCLYANNSNLSMQPINTSSTAQSWYITPVDNGYRIANGSTPFYLFTVYNEIHNSTTAVYSMRYTTGSTWELKLIEMPVPLLEQQANDTCSAASGAMVSQFYGCSNVTENEFKDRAVAMYSGQWNFAYAVAGTLNYFLEQNGTDARYTTPYISSFNLSTYTEMVLANIQNGHPLLVQVKIYETTYFPYISNNSYGHYVVVIGAYYDSQSNQYMLIVNDPHDQYCDRYIVPLSAIYSYNVRHTGCVFRVE
ncbi:MAG: RICIN domain-containing protein [Clostridia bacterium]|nr:RICIN domain-containing protein [Clostridia bacterium]